MNWESFFDNLTAGQIVPVIGNDLILVKDEEKNDTPVPLYSYLAREWTRKLDITYEGQTLGELALTYPGNDIYKTTHSIFIKMGEAKDRFDLEPLEKLAAIDNFNFFVSTTLDGLLVKALYNKRKLKKNQVKVINYSQRHPSFHVLHEDKEEPKVTVFNLLGSFGNPIPPAFNDEEMLEHFLLLFKNYKNSIAYTLEDYFFEKVSNKILLFVGCDFPDWFMRFIIRIISNQRYLDRSSSFSDYIIWNEIGKFPKLNTFLKQFKKKIYPPKDVPDGNVRVFIDELYERWTEVEKQPPKYKGTVFLSYSNPDQSEARKLKKILQQSGIKSVWIDIEDKEAGEHQVVIKENLKKCRVFVPMISNNALNNIEGYMWKAECDLIQARLKVESAQNKPNIIPIILDKTKDTDSRIPPGFIPNYFIWKMPQDQERIIEEIKKSLKKK